ncbi:MAG TPA: VWA domain-containing protein [Stellaceae bacterium]|nr:VWA domain-containing protein [Stellaceae bacterium]
MANDRDRDKQLPADRQSAEVEAFLRQVKTMPALRPESGRGRLIFSLDATASREATWDHACRLQGEMFEAAAALGGLDVQLVFYRGFHECKASRWLGTAADLHRAMRRVSCVGGETQIGRVLAHALREARAEKVNALVFVGDAMEEKLDELSHLAGELGLLGVPIFVFHEGGDETAGSAFRQIARLSGGAYGRFDAASAQQLRQLLGAVAAYAAGGRAALTAYGNRAGGAARLLAGAIGGTESG